MNETDLYETDDPVIKLIPKQDSQTSPEINTLLTEIQYHNFNDIHLSEELLTKITNSSSNVIKANNTNAITQTPIKSTSTQPLPFFEPSFFA